MTDRPRNLGLHPGLIIGSTRGDLTPVQIDFAEQKRLGGISWQNIAKMLGVNAIDLQRAVQRSAPPPAQPTARAAVQTAPELKDAAVPLALRVLQALAAGAEGRASTLGAVLDADPRTINMALSRLRRLDLVAQAEARAVNILTRKGSVQLQSQATRGKTPRAPRAWDHDPGDAGARAAFRTRRA